MHIHIKDVCCPLCDGCQGFSIVLDTTREATNGALLATEYLARGGFFAEALRTVSGDETLFSEIANKHIGRGTRVICEDCNIDETIESMPLTLDEIAEVV